MSFRRTIVFFSLVLSVALAPRVLSACHSNIGYLALTDAILSADRYARIAFAGTAQTRFSAALTVSPTNVRARRGKIIAEWKAGQLESARESLMDYIADSPDDKSAQLFLGDIVLELGGTEDAVQIWRSLQARPLFVGRARQYLVADELELAEIAMDVARLSDSDGSNPIADALLADQYADLARYYEGHNSSGEFTLNCQKARDAYTTALDRAPSNYVLRMHFGTLLRDCHLPDEALAQLMQIDSRYSATIQAWANVEIGLTYQQQNQLSTAVIYFESAVQLDPSHGGHRILLGSLYGRLGRTAEALAQLKLAAQTENSNWQAWAQQVITQLDRQQDLGDGDNSRK